MNSQTDKEQQLIDCIEAINQQLDDIQGQDQQAVKRVITDMLLIIAHAKSCLKYVKAHGKDVDKAH